MFVGACYGYWFCILHVLVILASGFLVLSSGAFGYFCVLVCLFVLGLS